MGLFRRGTRGREEEPARTGSSQEDGFDPVRTAEAFAAWLSSIDSAGELGPFDFSFASLRGLDDFVSGLAEFGEPLDRATESGAACYLAECLRRAHGGGYAVGPDPERDPFALVHQGDGFQVVALFFHRIRDRYDNGPEDDIPFFADGYPEALGRAANATLV